MKRVWFISFCLVVALVALPCLTSAQSAKSYDVDWYGYFKLDGSFDQNPTSHGNFAMWVQPKNYEQDDQQFNMTANQTRFGLKIKGNNTEKAVVQGKLEFDLYAGVTGATIAQNKPMLQLRHAFFSIQKGGTKLLAGQTWDIISPLNPSTVNYPVLWGCGNIGYRRPQVSLWQSFNTSENSTVTVAAGVFRTIGNDLTPTFSLAVGEAADGADDGTDAAVPSVQGLLDINMKLGESGSLRLGASGLYGQLKSESNLGNSENYSSWAGVGHMAISFSKNVGLSGEFYTGSNLGSYFGGILNNSTIDGFESSGGWGSAWFRVAPKVKFGAGFGMDQAKEEDLSIGQRAKNQCIYGNVGYDIVPQVTVALEVSNWKTEYFASEEVDCLRFQSAFILNF